jgi:hypothetical protein
MISQGRFGDIETLINFELLPDELEAFNRIRKTGVIESAAASEAFFKQAVKGLLPQIAVNAFTFNPNNPAVRRAIEMQGAIMIQGITENSRAAIRRVIIEGQLNGVPAREMAKTIQQSIGLTQKQAQAVANFKTNLRNQQIGRISQLGRTVIAPRIGLRNMRNTKDREKFLAAAGRKSIEQLGDEYAQRLLMKRAENIARTESFRATMLGQQVVWDEGANQGLFDRTRARKQWHVISDERTCQICAPMEGQIVPMDREFISPYDGSSAQHPPIHSHCRCHTSLVLPEP